MGAQRVAPGGNKQTEEERAFKQVAARELKMDFRGR